MMISLYGQIHFMENNMLHTPIKMNHFDGVVFLCRSELTLLNPDKEARTETKGRCL